MLMSQKTMEAILSDEFSVTDRVFPPNWAMYDIHRHNGVFYFSQLWEKSLAGVLISSDDQPEVSPESNPRPRRRGGISDVTQHPRPSGVWD